MTDDQERELRANARKLAQDFLAHNSEYKLGFIEAEQPNPLTKGLGETAQKSPQDAVRMILRVDAALADTFECVAAGEAWQAFARHVQEVVLTGGRLVLSGCGATGRLCLNLEAAWRRALQNLQKASPADGAWLRGLENQVVTIMTGGDYALIKSVECFEDYAELGRRQVMETGVGPGDLLIGVTATAETTSILGTAMEAARRGAGVEMLVCSDPRLVAARLSRAAELYEHPGVHSVYMPCGGLAVTGSTRMQSATIEQLACGVAMQEAMNAALQQKGFSAPEPIDYAASFTGLIQQLGRSPVIQAIGEHAHREAQLYQSGGKLTYFADEYLLDVLSDTTERSPTFMVPPFRPLGSLVGEASWAFVKNPGCPTAEAWNRCLAHTPRCVAWTAEDYRRFGVQVSPIPKIALNDLLGYPIGNESDSERESSPNSLAVWVGQREPTQAYALQGARYAHCTELTLDGLALTFPQTPMKLMEHLAMKMIFNTLSTVSMGEMGRLTSNFMTWMDMSNKKLVDRSARLIEQECGMPYETALEELYDSKIRIDAGLTDRQSSPVQVTIRRLKNNRLCT